MSNTERLERIVDELDYQNILLRNEIHFAEELSYALSQDLSECVDTLKEVLRFLDAIHRGPRQRVRDCIMRAENPERIKKLNIG